MKKVISILICTVLVFSLAACGNNDTPPTPAEDNTAPAATTTEPTAPVETSNDDNTPAPVNVSYSQGASDTEIIVGNSAATSGAFGFVGVPFNEGIKAYFDMVNSGGGIDNRQVIFKYFTDDEADPVKGKAALEGMVEDENYFAIVGALGTPVVAAIIDDMKEYGIPCVYFATGIPQLHANGATTNEEGYNIFPVQPLYETEGRILAAYAAGKYGAKNIGIIYTNDDAGVTLHKGVVAQINEMSGVTLTDERQVTAGDADVSAAVTAMKNADVDFIIVASIQATFPTIIKELAAQSVNVDCITTYVNNALDMSESVVDEIAGKFDVYSTAWVDAFDPSVADFIQWIPEDYVTNSFAMAGWIAGASFIEGLKRIEGQDITWDNYMRAMEQGPITLPFGAAVDYSGGNRWGTQAMSLSKIVPVSDDDPMGWLEAAPVTNIADLVK